ncbi:PIG-L family deacetylase [Streptomyces sp. NBC_01264]|uniref:PIG-L family deacetylase n=1 Tax=Streptomyces sp. NBC_01264 TaxID=2903804 RepID=UPI0022580A43|nr:PIG-L family deacetylase [Streptomyces sp. NBC_01264]MCX4781700.1 PIG-L family deacetylase [Streptomyces sp. NBC_01264]
MIPSVLRSPARLKGVTAALVFLLCLAVTLGIVIGGPQASAEASAQVQRSATVASLSTGPTRVVQIVAHPDDDLFFMNPDIQQAVSEGIPVTSVYLTSGESDGVNMNSTGIAALHREGLAPVADRPLYAEARQNGIRAAYALMATGIRTSPWQRTVIATAGGGQAELDVLRAKPSVQLVWLEMKEAGSVSGYAPVSLHGLWDGVTRRIPSLLTTGTPVRKPFSYTRNQVVSTLVGVLERYRPTLVRTQDPTPGKYPNADHQDHVYGARFVQAALARYAAAVPFGQRPHFTVENYLGYQTHNYAEVLDAPAAGRKLRTLAAYAWSNGIDDCGSPAGCGDRKLATGIGEYHWADDIRYARGGSTSWLAAGPDGTTWAFSVLDGQLAVWHGTAGGAWSDARLLPGTGIDQGADAVTLPDGRIAVFATRTDLGATAADYSRQVVYTVQETPGGEGFSPWQSLGAPATDNVNGTLDFSAPAAAVGPDGRLSVYVRDGNYTLRGRTQTADGSWTPWEFLGGRGLAGDPVTATAADGTRFLFAATATSVTAWTSQGPDGELGSAVATGLPATTLPLTAAPSGEGVGLWFREPVSGDVLRTEATTGPEGLQLSPVTGAGGGAGGYGPTAACADGVTARGAGGFLGEGNASGRSWSRSPLPFVGGPADVCRAAGPTVGVVGWDARLHVAYSA